MGLNEDWNSASKIPLQDEWDKAVPLTNPLAEESLSSLSFGQKYLDTVKSFLVGAGGKMVDVYQGARNLVASPFVSPQTMFQMQKEREGTRAILEPLLEGSNAAKTGAVVGGTVPFLIIPGGVSGGAVMRAVTAAGAGALQGAIEGEKPIEGAIKGALLGAGTSGVMSGGGQVINAIKATKKGLPSNLYGIPQTYGERTNRPFVQKIEVLDEKIPFSGMTRFRQKQNIATTKAATEHFSQYVVDPSLDTTAAMKEANDIFLDSLYKGVKRQTKNIPKVSAPEVKTATTELLDRYPTVFESIQDNHIKKILKNVYGDVKNKTVKTGILNPMGQEIGRKVAPEFSFNDLWELRKGIGKEIRDARTDTAKGVMNQVYKAVSTDMDNMLAGSVPEALRDFKRANQAFQQYSVKFDAMREAYDRAMGTTSAGEMFSPKTYSTALKKLANDPNYKKNVHWNPEEITNMTGLANVMQVVKRAGQFKENPATGNRFVDLFLLKQSLKLPVLPVAWATTFLTTSKTGQNLLKVASKVEPQSEMMAKIVQQLYRQAPKAVVSAGTNP